MTTERKNERDFGIYNIAKDLFCNLDYLNPFDDQEEFVNEPQTYTYEECERFIIHKEYKSDLTILNLKQPKFLLAFHLDILRKQNSDNHLSENKKYDEQQAVSIKMQTEENSIQRNKQSFYNDLYNWQVDINSEQTQISGKMSEKLQQKPNIESYGLISDNFTSQEKLTINKNYNTSI